MFLCSILQEDKNEQNCWFFEKSSLNQVFFDADQLYTVHRPLRSCQKLVRIRSDINLRFEYCVNNSHEFSLEATDSSC